MADSAPIDDLAAPTQEVLGYLNFSSGAFDAKLYRNLNVLWERLEGPDREADDTAARARELLAARLDALAGRVPGFDDVVQARAVLALAFGDVLAGYREHHRDLLFHQPDAALWRPFFVARVCEAVLGEGPPWDETERIVAGAVARLNDFIGHRPVAVLRTAQRLEPYPHERLRPVPLYVRGVGVATGRFRPVLTTALEILRQTDPDVLFEAEFDMELVDELALDPRAYDFDHPVNKRPNYHFGQWDPHHLDNRGRYRRFVVQQVTLEALLGRIETERQRPRDELLFEAAAVLAGTILMSSGTSGSGPAAYDSALRLGQLVQRIAEYRDTFYDQLLERASGAHGERLGAEARARRQPFAAARQHLNMALAARRADQLVHVSLSQLYAQLGYPTEAQREAAVVNTPAARMAAEIRSHVRAGELALSAGRLPDAAAELPQAIDVLHRAIACGALIDPWNILGFQGQFSLFPAPDSSVGDQRVDQLIDLVGEILQFAARAIGEAAAHDQGEIGRHVERAADALAAWWDKFATTTVEGVESFTGHEVVESARQVAQALAAWRTSPAAAETAEFWRQHAAGFRSPKAYALVVTALLERNDLAAAMALLVHWVSQASEVPLAQRGYWFHHLAQRWLDAAASAPAPAAAGAEEPQGLVERFFEQLAAASGPMGEVPQMELSDGVAGPEEDEDEEEETQLYGAAYDEMVYVDSTSDGVEGEMLEWDGATTDFELEAESRRLRGRLAFHATLAVLWRRAAIDAAARKLRPHWIERALAQAETSAARLDELAAAIARQRIAPPTASVESMLEYDRRQAVKESLLEIVVAASVDVRDALRSLRAAAARTVDGPLDAVWQAMLRGDSLGVRRRWRAALSQMRRQTTLFVPIARGGAPAAVVAARTFQRLLRDLGRWLPRLGLLREACQVLVLARQIEATNPLGPGAVSEFDRLFKAGYQAIVDSLVEMSAAWQDGTAQGVQRAEAALVDCLEQLTDRLHQQWLAHSRALRLSVLERVADERQWQALTEFVRRYGRDLFTQTFLAYGNLRALTHQGAEAWLDGLAELPDDEPRPQLAEDLGELVSREDAVRHLNLVVEAVLESYSEYRDYNTTTTQSDRGDLLYTLLDFLRLRVQYDRVAWNLQPVVWVHEVLVRRARSAAAEAWQQTLAEKTSDIADKLLARLERLRQKYGMQLSSVAERLAQRFVRPLAIDRVKALVRPAMRDARRGVTPSPAFEALAAELSELAREPAGPGLEAPEWIEAIEQEVREVGRWPAASPDGDDARVWFRQTPLSVDEVHQQLSIGLKDEPEGKADQR